MLSLRAEKRERRSLAPAGMNEDQIARLNQQQKCCPMSRSTAPLHGRVISRNLTRVKWWK